MPEAATATLARWSGTKVATFENIATFEELGPMEVEVTEELMKAYAFSMDDYRAWHFGPSPFGPPIGHAAIVGNDLLNVKYGVYDRMTVVGLHTDEELIFHAPIPLGETVTITGRYVVKDILRGKGHAVMEAEARDASGKLLVQHRNSELTRVDPGETTASAGTAQPSRRVVPDALSADPVETVRPGLRAETPIKGKTTRLTQAQMSVFSYIGEYERNFHNDREFANENGLERTIAQGQQSAGFFSDICTGFFGAPWFTSGRVKAKFLLPVFPDSVLRIKGKVVGQEAARGGLRTHVDMWIRDQDDRLVSVGWASAVTPDSTFN
ncbi:MaoC/PaaZ C-terminal domain-containing protein [Paramicrobacterium chengjingii]|uniref:MaoC-like domain-containing protein n=1 Tax=Paramicrobacterium chengjingii TaxID=2769067 RepID=A0ABX6YIR9_9MICO|nr:MaoC/PaaZ C-terminal domain-containing protein [Microbacterium chengjingii]QPZ38250.1 hypothetical protein HCR76_15905 [Microbacterium chengjingii]